MKQSRRWWEVGLDLLALHFPGLIAAIVITFIYLTVRNSLIWDFLW